MSNKPNVEIVLYCPTPSSSALENIKLWIKPFSKSAIIYSATPVPIREIDHFKRVVIVPNLLTESQAYLHHIASKGKSLELVTIFCHSDSRHTITASISRMVELAGLTQVGEVMTFPGIDLVLFDAWELSSPSKSTMNKKGNGSISSQQRGQASPDDGLIQLSGNALNLLKTEEHSVDTPASVFWNAMAPSPKHKTFPVAIGYQPGCTFAVHRDTILQKADTHWSKLYAQYFNPEASSVASLEAGYYLSKFWWAFFSDEYILNDGDAVDKQKWVEKSGGRKELTKGNWARRLQPDAIGANTKEGRNLHHFRTGSCSIDSENLYIRNMTLYGLPSLSPLLEKSQAQALGIAPSQIALRKSRSMGLPTFEMSKLEIDTPAKIHRSVSENSAY